MGENVKTEIQRIGGYLKEVVTFLDDSGNPISHVMNPLMVELRPRDLTQIFVGSLVISIPMCFTEEVWVLGQKLKSGNIWMIFACSILAVTTFVYFNFYRFKLKGNILEFAKRILAIYVISALSVTLVLFLIDKLPFMTDRAIAFNRIVIISFPAIFGATITDYLK